MTKRVFFVNPPATCDGCGKPIGDEFIDGKTKVGPWGYLCLTCWTQFGVGPLGTGFGQRYRKQPDGRFLKVEG